MGELIHPFIRDNKYFMYLFYMYTYRGSNLREVMEFKKNVYSMSDEEYEFFIKNSAACLAKERPT